VERVADEGERSLSKRAQELLDAAERLLDREGLAGLSTRSIAREADCNAGLIHYHFESLDDLCGELLDRVSAGLLRQQERAFAPGQPFLVQWAHVTKPLRGKQRRWAKVWFELTAMAVNHEDLAKRFAAVEEDWLAILRQAVGDELVRRGREGDDVDAWAELALVVMRGLYLDHIRGPSARGPRVLGLLDDLLS
jgi:AcrR family transcriptional regulator